MYPDFAASVHERIHDTVSHLEISACYQSLMLSIVSQALKPYAGITSARTSTLFLPAVVASAFGEDMNRTLNVTSAWLLMQLSAHLLDKVEDQEVDHSLDYLERPDLMVNISTGFIFAAEYLLDHLGKDGIDPLTAAEIRHAFNKQILHVCGGQHDDLSIAHPNLDLCWQITKVKSGMFFALGCYAGALVGTADPDQLALCWDYGMHLGMIKQIVDDVESFIKQEDQKSDFASGKWTLPVAYSVGILPEPNAGMLKDMLYKARYDRGAEESAREKMIQAGALLYLKLETMKHAFQANQAIRNIYCDHFIQKDLVDLLIQTAGLEEHALS